MFLFNKSSSSTAAGKKPEHPAVVDRPLSRHQTVTPSSIASSSDGMSMSDHRRARSEHRKRTSVFSGRSRSKTDYSSNNSMHSAEAFSRRTSQDGISIAESTNSRPGAPPDPSSKWFFPRASKRIRHQHSKSSLHSMHSMKSMTADSINDTANVPRLFVDKNQQPGRPRASTYSLALSNMKRTISVPFNFQHITHTDSGQFPELDRASEHELASEFSAIRASQAPRREIRGIRVQDLHYRNFSSDAVTSLSNQVNDDTFPTLPSGQSPDFQRLQTPSPSGSHRTFGPTPPLGARHSFRARSPTSPITPPPRTSSRQALTISYDALPETQTAFGPDRPNTAAGFRTPTSLDGLMLTPHSPTSAAMQAPHAVTTPDDSAWQLKPPAFLGAGSGLADVPEEEESIFSKRSSRRSSRPNSSGSALRQTQSLGDMKSMLDQASSRASVLRAADWQRNERPISGVSDSSDTLEGPYCTPPVKGAVGISGTSRRLSVGLHAVEGCWEDDIDYCYEHEAEADCDYDWDRSSEDGRDSSSASATADSAIFERNGPAEEPATPPLSSSSEASPKAIEHGRDDSPKLEESQSYSSISKPPLLVPTYVHNSADPQSAQSVGSAITIDSDLVTPLSPPNVGGFSYNRPVSYASTTFKESDGFNISPSLLIPADFRTHMLPDGYDDLTTPDKHVYPLYNPTDALDAARASTPGFRSPLSQSTSQESMAVSHPPSKHQSNNSGGSLPELIQSRNVRQEFDQAAEQLADHIAALNTADHSTGPQRSKSHRHERNRSLAKDVAQKSVLRKVASSSNMVDQASNSPKESPVLSSSDEEAAIPAPISFGQRSRTAKDLSKIKIVAKVENSQGEISTSPQSPKSPKSPHSPQSPQSPRTLQYVSRIPMPTRTPPRSPSTSIDYSRIPSPVFAAQRSRAVSEATSKAPKIMPRSVGKHVRATSSVTRYTSRVS